MTAAVKEIIERDRKVRSRVSDFQKNELPNFKKGLNVKDGEKPSIQPMYSNAGRKSAL